jgi:hypothetical protein
MHRIFLGLAITVLVLLLLSFGLGFAAGGEAGSPDHARLDLHFLFGLATMLAALLIHSIVFTYFLGTGRWVKEVVRVYELPQWVWPQALKNKRKAFPFEILGMTLIGLTVWSGAGAHTGRWPAVWHLGLAALTLGFNLGAFFAEYAAIVAQARLLLEVKDQADRLRQSLAADRTEHPLTPA